MTAQSVKYFEHWSDGHRRLQVHRLDELVQVTVTNGIEDPDPLVLFLSPTAGHGLAGAVEAAARDARAIFEAAQAQRRAERSGEGLPAWGPAFTFGGLPYTLCPAGDGRVAHGQSAVPETATGRIWHVDCAEAARESLSRPDSPAPASAPPAAADASAVGGAHGAAGAGSSSAVAGSPAAPNPAPADLCVSSIGHPFGEVGETGGADGAAGADWPSAVADRPAAPFMT